MSFIASAPMLQLTQNVQGLLSLPAPFLSEEWMPMSMTTSWRTRHKSNKLEEMTNHHETNSSLVDWCLAQTLTGLWLCQKNLTSWVHPYCCIQWHQYQYHIFVLWQCSKYIIHRMIQNDSTKWFMSYYYELQLRYDMIWFDNEMIWVMRVLYMSHMRSHHMNVKLWNCQINR